MVKCTKSHLVAGLRPDTLGETLGRPHPLSGGRHGRRHGGSRVGKRPPWKKSGWAWPTLEILGVV